MSLAERPCNTGTRFHNHLYEALGLNYAYKALTTQELPAAIDGCAISMPFEEACITLLDELAPSATVIRLGEHHRQRPGPAEELQHRLPRRRAAARKPWGIASPELRPARQRQGKGRDLFAP
ncbi:hypothetical protein GCM10027514_25990 [Azotobacter armeniacus]